MALGYWFYQFSQTSFDAFGWQFRFLTIWGLTAALIVLYLMLRYSIGRGDRTYNPFVSAAAVLEAIVVFMYWKLWFIDPSLVNSSDPIIWYQEYYLHAVGPALLAFDAFFILGVLRRIVPTAAVMLVVFLTYISWLEFLVAPLNSFPEGEKTNGLPYPFLNDMGDYDRWAFYATTIGAAFVFMLTGWGIAKGLRLIRR